jgi:spermidine synthase
MNPVLKNREDALAVQRAHKRILQSFPIRAPLPGPYPSYPSVHWLFGFASKRYHPVRDLRTRQWEALGLKTKYYNLHLHKGAFALPNYVEELLKKCGTEC